MKKKMDLVALTVSVIAGCVWWLLGELLYKSLSGVLSAPVVIGLYFSGLAIMLIACCFVSALLRGFILPPRKEFVKSALVVVVIALLSGIFQFLYSLDGVRNTAEQTSYVFLLDDSGSMQANDPNNERAAAIMEIMKKKEATFPFAVYGFTNVCRQIIPITSADQVESIQIHLSSNGQTNMASAIDTVLDDLESGYLKGGNSPRIILLSDGVDMDTTIVSVIQRAISNNVSISTVGLGSADEAYLMRIARDTGGVYVRVDFIDGIVSAIESAAVSTGTMKRTLVGLRETMQHNWLYGVLRSVFLFILGIGFFIIKSYLMRTNDKESDVFIENALPPLIGALTVELLINTLGFNELIARAVMCICFCLLLNIFVKERYCLSEKKVHIVEKESDNNNTGVFGY